MQHKALAAGRWGVFSLAEQLGNIGSEVSRAMLWRSKDSAIFEHAVFRVLELFDLTLVDPRWRTRLRELARAREIFCDAISGGALYGSRLEDVNQYLLPFAFAARRMR